MVQASLEVSLLKHLDKYFPKQPCLFHALVSDAPNEERLSHKIDDILNIRIYNILPPNDPLLDYIGTVITCLLQHI